MKEFTDNSEKAFHAFNDVLQPIPWIFQLVEKEKPKKFEASNFKPKRKKNCQSNSQQSRHLDNNKRIIEWNKSTKRSLDPTQAKFAVETRKDKEVGGGHSATTKWHSHQSINQSTYQSINRFVNQSINQSIDLSINQSIRQSINQSIDLSINQSIDLSINQSRELRLPTTTKIPTWKQPPSKLSFFPEISEWKDTTRRDSPCPGAANTPHQVKVFGHDGDAARVQRTLLGVLEEADQEGLRGLLQRQQRLALPTQWPPTAERSVPGNLAHQSGEGQLA